MDFRTKTITNDRGTFHNDKGPIHYEDITILNVDALGNRASEYMKN